MARNHRTRSKTKFGNCFAHVLQILRSHELDFPHRIPGHALANKDNWNEAIGFYQTALRARPDHIKAHNNLGVALAITGKTDEAVAQFREALRIDADFADAHANLGHLFLQLGQRDEAAAELRETLRLKPDDAEVKDQLLQLEFKK